MTKPVFSIGFTMSDKLGIIPPGKILFCINGWTGPGGSTLPIVCNKPITSSVKMSCTFLKAQGFDIGDSMLEKDLLNFAKEMIQKSKKKKVDLLLPNDAMIADSFENKAIKKLKERLEE